MGSCTSPAWGVVMKTLLIVIALLSFSIAAAPTALAEPCEVPGCTVVGATLCLANATLNGEVTPKDPWAVSYCLHHTA